MGIEPTSEAWEAPVLPLYYARSVEKHLEHNIVVERRARSRKPLPSRWSCRQIKTLIPGSKLSPKLERARNAKSVRSVPLPTTGSRYLISG